MPLATTAGLAMGGLAVAAYLNARLHLQRDLKTLTTLKRGEIEFARAERQNRVSLWYTFEEQCKQRWDQRAIWSRERCYTFGGFHDECVRYAHWMLHQGVRPGELVGVYMTNSPDFMIVWFACIAIGTAPAALNYNLEGKALLHCLSIAGTKLLVVSDDDCQKTILASRGEIESQGVQIAVLNGETKSLIASMPTQRIPDEARDGVKGNDPFTLIYTSGTTGLPKGFPFHYQRIYSACGQNTPLCGGIPGQDQWYNCMPLYHGTGGMSCALALLNGISIAIGPKFSASRFWDDIYDSGSTFFVYVGETARYLLNAPPHPLERKHNVRCIYGNGLRPDVWEKFQTRFNIPEVGEFFNSTEGMFALLNHSRGSFLRACVGHHGALLRPLLHNTFVPVKIDYETGEILRDPKTGFATRPPYEEGGEILVAVPNREAFLGYWRSQAATDKKICANVFKKGDLYYRTGDALRRDSDGRWYFLDRLGDTFRWKSENVSTAEVALVLGRYPGIAEANVYGVLVPSHEGRAGCAAIHLAPGETPSSVDYRELTKYLRQELPKYAVPVFLRMVKASTHIHNYKQNKVPLRKEGVDPALIGTQGAEGSDDLFLWLPPQSDRYIPFLPSDYSMLSSGQARL